VRPGERQAPPGPSLLEVRRRILDETVVTLACPSCRQELVLDALDAILSKGALLCRKHKVPLAVVRAVRRDAT